MNTLQRTLSCPTTSALEALTEAAEIWGAEWQPEATGGRLLLPVVHGLRRGVVDAIVTLTPEGDTTTLDLAIEGTHLSLNRSALAILVLGGLGGLAVVLWPLSPAILQLAPIGAVLALLAWLMVVSRLRNSSPEDFLDLVEAGL